MWLHPVENKNNLHLFLQVDATTQLFSFVYWKKIDQWFNYPTSKIWIHDFPEIIREFFLLIFNNFVYLRIHSKWHVINHQRWFSMKNQNHYITTNWQNFSVHYDLLGSICYTWHVYVQYFVTQIINQNLIF